VPVLPGTDHTARVAFMWTYDGQQCESIFYVEDDTDDMFANVPATVTILAAAWDANIMPRFYTTAAHVATGFEDVRTVPFAGAVIPESPPTNGSLSSSSPLPGSVNFVIKKSTGNLGRSGRGRMYWPVFEDGNLVGASGMNTTYANLAVTALEDMQSDIETNLAGSKLGIVSYYHDKVLRTAGLFQQITDFGLVDYIVDNQRRRLPGRGR